MSVLEQCVRYKTLLLKCKWIVIVIWKINEQCSLAKKNTRQCWMRIQRARVGVGADPDMRGNTSSNGCRGVIMRVTEDEIKVKCCRRGHSCTTTIPWRIKAHTCYMVYIVKFIISSNGLFFIFFSKM